MLKYLTDLINNKISFLQKKYYCLYKLSGQGFLKLASYIKSSSHVTSTAQVMIDGEDATLLPPNLQNMWRG